MILAAGQGHRLYPLTQRKPKPMLEVAGHPALEYNVRLLVHYGITAIVINVHHRGEVIVDYFGDGSRFGAAITYSYEERLLGTAGGVARARELFDEEPFMLVYGDNISNCNLQALLQFHRDRAATATLALFVRPNATASGIVSIDIEGRITRFLEKPGTEQVFSSLVNAGILMLEPTIFAFIPQAPCDLSKDVLPRMLAHGEALYGYRMNEQLWWIDSIEDYERTTLEFPSLSAFPFSF